MSLASCVIVSASCCYNFDMDEFRMSPAVWDPLLDRLSSETTSFFFFEVALSLVSDKSLSLELVLLFSLFEREELLLAELRTTAFLTFLALLTEEDEEAEDAEDEEPESDEPLLALSSSESLPISSL